MELPFKPLTRLMIKPEIATKIIGKHGLEIEFVRALFFKHQWKARLLPPLPGDPPWDPPRYLADIWEGGRRYRLVYSMVNPPGTEAFLVTCFDPDAKKRAHQKPSNE